MKLVNAFYASVRVCTRMTTPWLPKWVMWWQKCPPVIYDWYFRLVNYCNLHEEWKKVREKKEHWLKLSSSTIKSSINYISRPFALSSGKVNGIALMHVHAVSHALFQHTALVESLLCLYVLPVDWIPNPWGWPITKMEAPCRKKIPNCDKHTPIGWFLLGSRIKKSNIFILSSRMIHCRHLFGSLDGQKEYVPSTGARFYTFFESTRKLV